MARQVAVGALPDIMPQASDLVLIQTASGTGTASVENIVAAGGLALGDAGVFQQIGTGSVARSVNGKLREFVSVKDFGAVGDGSADDTLSITRAVAAVNAAGGGVVYFPFGTYKTAGTLNFVGASNIILAGAAKGATTIRVASGSVAGSTPLSFVDCTQIGVEKMTLDGNIAGNPSGGHGIRLDNCDDVILDNLDIRNAAGYGMGFQSTFGDYKRLRITNCDIFAAGVDGIDIKNKGYTNESIFLENLYIEGPGDGKVAIDVRGPAVINNVHIKLTEAGSLGLRMRGTDIAVSGLPTGTNTGPGGMYGNVSNVTVSCNNQSLQQAFVVDDPYINFVNCRAIDPGVTGFSLTANAHHCQFTNCHVIVTGTAAPIGFDIGCDSSSFVNCSTKYATNVGTGIRLNGTLNYLVTCRVDGGQYGFRTTSGVGGCYLLLCEVLTATNKYSISAAHNLISCVGFNTTQSLIANYTAGSDVAITGYITVKDDAGTARKLAVIA